MPAGLGQQGTQWICGRCANSSRFWPGVDKWRYTLPYLSLIRYSRLASTLAARLLEDDSKTTSEAADAKSTRRWGPVPYRRKPNIKNIFVDDLSATLEAHRAANRAKLIRRIAYLPQVENFFRLKLPTKTNKSASRPQRVNPPSKPSQKSNLADTIPKSDPPVGPSEHGLAEAQVPGLSTSAPIQVRKGVFAIQPVGVWYCRWGSTSGPTFGATQQPWQDSVQKREADPMLQLDEEMRAFERYMTPDPEEETAVQNLIAHVKEIVATVAPSSELIVHGSRYTKLAGPLSDIDFCLLLPEYEKNPLERGPSSSRRQAMRATQQLLRRIQRALRPIARENSVEFIHARIPIVAALDKATGLSLQFSALAPYFPAREYTMLYLSEFPGLRTLYVMLRHSLLIRQLTTVHDGGLGSYPLLIMIVTALKHFGTTFGRDELARSLLHVLDFWSHADLQKNGYSADPPRVFSKTAKRFSLEAKEEHASDPILKGIDLIRKPRETKPWLLCLQDPGNPINDLGKNALSIVKVQAVFSYFYRSLAKSIRRWEHMEKDRREHFSFLDPLVRAKYDGFERKRRAVRESSRITRVLPPLYQMGIYSAREDGVGSQDASITALTEEDTASAKMTGLQMAFEEEKEQGKADTRSVDEIPPP